MTTNEQSGMRGFSLIEVLIAVVILSFGMLALAALQGGLFRAGAETKARASATAFAQRRIEDIKSFGALKTGAVASYEAITTQTLALPATSGTQFYGCSQVRRYRYDKTTSKFVRLNDVNFSISNAGAVTCADTNVIAAGAVASGTPDFKEVKVSVGWFSEVGGPAKTVEIADSVASISPSDAIMLAQSNNAARQGPTVWIRPPNIDANGNIIPAVVPIAIGGDQAAASSNPKPTQYVDDVSSATLFSVQSFTGSGNTEVLLNRKLDVAAASCVCSDTGAVSTTTNPAYQPTLWNGKQLAYMTPATAPIGKKIGTSNVANADRNIQNLCTTCCRDHHDSSDQALKVDPYRPLVNGAHAHYGYQQQGSSYNIAGGLLPVGAGTNNQYVEACRLIRVNGLMRLAVDARQNDLMVTPLDAANPPTNFNQSDFISRYSSFVGDYVNYAAQNLPANYPGPSATYPASPLRAPTSAQLTTYSDIVSPPTISFSAAGQTRKMVTFGLYVDYLTPETLAAYNCALNNDNTGPCLGLGTRNKLEYLPFYAVNVANLGSWASAKTSVVSVVDAAFDNQGNLAADGGLATAGTSNLATAVPVQEEIGNSNSGLTSTAAIDPDDAADCTAASVPACSPYYSSYVVDLQNYLKTTGTAPPTRNSLFVKAGSASTISFSKIGMSATVGVCGYSSKTLAWNCRFDSPGSTTLTISNFTTSKLGVITNRKICVPFDARVTSPVITGDNTTAETFQVRVGPLNAVDYTLKIDIIDQGTTCPTGSATLLP